MRTITSNQRSRSRILYFWLLILLSIFLLAFQGPVWKVPASSAAMKNPVKYAGENTIIAKGLYTKHCKSCHGKSGEGDGTKAEELKTFPGDFTTDEFQDQSDGAIFYKIRAGRDEMPAFDKKISEEDSWLLVHYLRTFQ
ncbi:c-type cytochrome [Marinoscillum sp. MHG1-6]|uniref:c-type cytochrome n=1 Tax=Marinoscillum sp. MHG1-6 TaxID=2959627 RepID=UPI0021580B34|nr:c-type cytochrome [Marinoscillum sp. MHG1-6]